MKKERVPLLIVIIIFGTLLSPSLIHLSHAASGEICLADPTTSSGSTAPCPASAPVFDGPKGQQIRIGVFVSGSDGLDGFDVTLLTNHTLLRPAAVDLTGTVLIGTPVVLAECFSGVLVAGSSCSPATDNVDTIHLSATSALGSPLTLSPTTGLLFTAIYNVTGATAVGTPISVGFQTGCASTSASPNICVTIANGTPTPNVETTQSASFSNSDAATMAMVDVSASPTSFGPEFPSVSNTATVTATAVNGYPSLATDSVSFTTKASAGLTATLAGVNPCSTGGVSCAVTLSLSASAAGNYFVTVYGTYATIDPSDNPDTLVSTVTLNVVVDDFGLSVSPTSLSFSSGTSGTSIVTLTSLNGFAGPLNLSSGVILPPGLTIAFSPNPVAMTSGGTLTSTATFSASPSSTTTYRATLKAQSGSRIKTSVALTIQVAVGPTPDFLIAATPTSVTTSPGSIGTSSIAVTPVGGFNSPVTLNALAPTGLACSLSQGIINGSQISTLSCTASAGVYTATVTGTSGSLNHSVNVVFNFESTTVGLVCIATDGSNTCPSLLSLITSSSVIPQQLRVAVVIDNSATMNSFDIILHTNSTILKPADAIAGTVLTSSGLTVLAKCVGGVGIGCGPVDSKDTLHYAVVDGLAFSPVNGILFTAVYNVTGSTLGTTIGFQTGCTQTSIAGGVCVTIASGTPVPDPENVQTGLFANLPTFSLQTVFGVVSLRIAPGASDSSLVLNITSINNFAGTVTVATRVSPSGPTVRVSPASVTLNATSPIAYSQVNVTIALSLSPGTYLLTFNATGGPTSRSLMIPVTVISPDFSMTVSPPAIVFDMGQSSMATITLASLAGFSGPVTLTASVPVDLNLSMSQSSVNLRPDGTNSSILSISTNGLTQPQTYLISISGTSRSTTHIVTLIVNIADFAMDINPKTISLQPGDAGSTVVQLHAVNNFTGTVTVTASAPSGLTVTPVVEVVTVTPGAIFAFYLTVFTSVNAPAGNYTVTLSATSDTLTHTGQILVTLTVLVPPPKDFLFTINPTASTVTAGSNSSFTLTLTSAGGFTGTMLLSASVSPIAPSSSPLVFLEPSSIFLPSNASDMSSLLVSTSRTTPAQTYIITVSATNGTLTHVAYLTLQVLFPPDIPPVASFTFSPSNPTVGQNIRFDGSASFDPDGTVVFWSWNFGNGDLISGGAIVGFSYYTPGNYTVTLTVQDNAGLTGSTSMVVNVRPQPAHDVGIVQVNPYPTVVTSSESVAIQIVLINDGLSNETVSLTAYYSGHVIQTLNGVFLQACRPSPCSYNTYVEIVWDTTGVLPGNYTISASVSLPKGEVDPTPSDNNYTDGVVTVLPAPVMTLSPTSGPVGTKVQIQATGFLPQYGYPSIDQIWVTFDNNFLGEAFAHNGTFSFTFDVIQAQPGVHQVTAQDLYTFAKATANFTVTSTQTGSLTVTINTGTVYFPGDTVAVYVLTNFNGVPVGAPSVSLQIVLFRPNGSNVTLTAPRLGTGLYRATYTIPKTGPLGTYLIITKAHETGPLDSSAIASFEVKLSWLSSNGQNIAGAATAVGLVGLAGLAWKKGYLRKKHEDEPTQFF